MQRTFTIIALALALSLGASAVVFAQTGDASLIGYVKDQQGGVLPGVTITATSPALFNPSTTVTNASGYYRLINLPPGEYVITAELASFATRRREGILLRAGANFEVDIPMTIGSLEETILVKGESPMIEVNTPSTVLNISGEFQRGMPIQARRNWSDFLELAPGIHSRPFDDGSGRMVYFGHATEHFAHVIMLEGAIASNYQDAQATYVAMGADMVADVQVKTGGVDASSPSATGLVINVITKSGGNQFKGSAAYAYQPNGWNGNNTANCSPSPGCDPAAAGSGGTPTIAIINQFDGGLGGPIAKDKVWFFGSLRHSALESGISRTPVNVQNLRAFFPNMKMFNNTTKSWQPYVKVTAKPSDAHELAAFVQLDRLTATGNREYHFTDSTIYANGGALYAARITSAWSDKLATTFLVAYNNKGGSNASTYKGYSYTGPLTTIHNAAFAQGGRVVGTGRLIAGGNLDDYTVGLAAESIYPSSLWTIRADLTYFKTGWAGSHEFKTGFFGSPSSRYDIGTQYLNDGFIWEERQQIDPNNPAAGTVPFHREYVTPLSVANLAARDRTFAGYVQDSWKPNERLTANVGVRLDWVRRFDDIFKITRESSHNVQPRLGFSYLVTKDTRNVLRGSYVRVSEQMMGRDAVTTFGSTSKVTVVDQYSLDGFQTTLNTITTPAATTLLQASQFDPNLHQPYVDEFILGFRKQLPYSIGIDVAGIKRTYKDTYALLEINGFYPDGPNKPFGGFGAIDPNRGVVYEQTNNSWSRLNYTAIEITLTKNLSHGFEFMAGINRQWQHIGGTWNPHDPARFIQPDAFPSNALIYQPRGNNENISLPLTTGTNTLSYGPSWEKYRLNFGGSYHAPLGIVASASYTVEAGVWSGPIVTLLPADDPQLAVFGPPVAVSSTGVRQSNPLSTRMRFVYPTRGDGQVMAPAVKTLGLTIGKKIPLGSSREVEVAANIFNALNAGNYTQYNYSGANEQFNPNYLQFRNQQPARALQATLVFRF